MNADELLDPAYRWFMDEPSSNWTLHTLADIRARVSAPWATAATKRGEQHWTSSDSDNGVRLCLYRPDLSLSHSGLPVILYIHGGGFVLGSPEMADDYLAELAVELNAIIVAVDHRLAPEHPFPIPLEDCYAVLEWIFSLGPTLGMNTGNLVIMGHSAGGGLAAALALLARNKGLRTLAGLVLIYPMLDHRTGAPDAPPANPTTGTFS